MHEPDVPGQAPTLLNFMLMRTADVYQGHSLKDGNQTPPAKVVFL